VSSARRALAEARLGDEARDRPPAETDTDSDTPVFAAPSDLLDHRAEEKDLMARSLLGLWAIGATVFLVALVADPLSKGQTELLVLLDGVGLVALVIVALERSHLPAWTPEACSYLCQLMVSCVVWAYGSDSARFALFYLWFAVHAFYFLPWRRAARQLVVVALSYAVALAAAGAGGKAAVQWALTVATLGVICTMVAVLRRRVDALVARLAATAVTDAVTGLGNRRNFDDLLEREFERARRANHPLTLVLGDLDGFKAVNDSAGHRAGDEVLRRLAAVLDETCRRPEPPTRLGGDEFGFVLSDTDEFDGRRFAERVRIAIAHEFANDPYPVTISLGLATYPHHAPGLADLVRAADDAVYAAKRAGRNRTMVATTTREAVPARR
jgi:diguanylate cyclase (GGDEF)-like protein